MIKRLFALIFLLPVFAQAQNATYTINTSEIKASIQPSMWGIFFEDINRGADGGMYAELVKNRSFDFEKPLMGWTVMPVKIRDGVFMVINQQSTEPNNPKFMRVQLNAGEKVALVNEGFNGMGIKKDLRYEVSLRYRQAAAGVKLKFELVNATNKVIGSVAITPTLRQAQGDNANDWQLQTATITTTDTAQKGKLAIYFEGSGQLDIDRISLFPTDTWQQRAGGLRADLVQKLAELQPGFFRFPGGCIVEGKDINHRYQWKKTIGPLDERQLIMSIWADDVPHRQTPDYFQSFGLGFYEYFQLCEDLHTAPMPILNCGLSCQFDAAEVVPVDQLDPYVQDAIDLIEFANGDATTPWGKKRAELGHPAPFNLTMLGIGNENWGPQYLERLQLFTKAIKAKYPAIQLITSTGYSPRDQFRYMDSALRAQKVDIIDEHYYQSPNWFLMNAAKYDHYDRQGPKIFLGEYAAQSERIGSANNKNTLLCAISEAAFMTGLERNADIVTMAAYAPLFAHVDGWQWTPNLIWFDNLRSYATPSYYVQQLFARNRGTHVVPLLQEGEAVKGQDSCYASAVIDKATNEVIIKLVNSSGMAKPRTLNLPGLSKKQGSATVMVLQGGQPATVNSLEQPQAVAPTNSTLAWKNKQVAVTLAPYSVSVVRVKM
jgi:alpha-N-arabinofuranosidase